MLALADESRAGGGLLLDLDELLVLLLTLLDAFQSGRGCPAGDHHCVSLCVWCLSCVLFSCSHNGQGTKEGMEEGVDVLGGMNVVCVCYRRGMVVKESK